MTWLSLSLIAALLFALNSILGRYLAVKSDNPRAFALVYNSFAGLFALGFLLFDNTNFNLPPTQILWLTLLSILAYGIFNRFEFYARKHVDASTYPILTKFIPIITVVLAIIFLHESLTIRKVVAALLIVLGNVLAVYKGKGIDLKSGMKYATIIIVALGVA